MLSEIQIDCCKAAIKKMMEGGHFSISVIDEILSMTRGVPNADDYKTLRLLHCVSFKDFPPRLRIAFPNLLKRVLESPGMEIEITFRALSRPPSFLDV